MQTISHDRRGPQAGNGRHTIPTGVSIRPLVLHIAVDVRPTRCCRCGRSGLRASAPRAWRCTRYRPRCAIGRDVGSPWRRAAGRASAKRTPLHALVARDRHHDSSSGHAARRGDSWGRWPAFMAGTRVPSMVPSCGISPVTVSNPSTTPTRSRRPIGCRWAAWWRARVLWTCRFD